MDNKSNQTISKEEKITNTPMQQSNKLQQTMARNNETLTQPSNNSDTVKKSTTNDDALKPKAKKKRTPYVIFLIIEIIIIGGLAYLISEDINKYNSYTIIGADLFNQEKVYKAGKPYYKARYIYKVDNKEYYYDYPSLYSSEPDQIIQIKYNAKNPQEVYSRKTTIILIIAIACVGVLALITIGTIISLSTPQKQKIITAIIEDILILAHGRKIIMRNIDTPVDINNPNNTEYYSYFTENPQNFKIGQKLKFNANKYNEVLTTEIYNNIFETQNINELKLDDFIQVN